MNPIFRAAANGLSRSRSEGQIRLEKQKEMQKEKRRQEKEKRRIDALEREKKWMALGKVPGKKEEGSSHEPEATVRMAEWEGGASPVLDRTAPGAVLKVTSTLGTVDGSAVVVLRQSAAEKFQKELCWCIQQLEMGLANMKPNPKQAQEVEKVLRTLKSPKAPIAKKRQVMRTTFGDYRSKMLQEEKKHASVIASKTNITKVAPNKINQATFFRKSSGIGLHQRSVSSPASYMPSLSPTKEEATGSGSVGEVASDAPSGEDRDSATSNNTGGNEQNAANCTKATNQVSSDNANDILSREGDEGHCANNSNSETVEGPQLQNVLESIEKESPTHSTVSTVSSESFNPVTTSSSSSLSSHEVTPSSLAQSCQTFRFDFRIEERQNHEESESGKKEEAESAKNRQNDRQKETENSISTPLPVEGGGNSPVIESNVAKEGKKKKRNRKKRKKKESQLIGDKEENKRELTENQKETASDMKLSLGGGDFKFNFDDKLELNEGKQ